MPGVALAVSLSFLTPLAALLVLAALVPLAALRRGESQARAVARSLGLPDGRPERAALAALVAVAALLALAASQPVLAFDAERRVRADAEVYVVLDTTRSMLAAERRGASTRFDRAKRDAAALRAELGDVRVGLASFTDRVLPHLFPSGDGELYAATLARSLRVEHPPPEREWDERATTFAALSALATRNFYSQPARRRVAVLLTDGETRQYSLPALAAILQRPPAVVPVLVHVRREGERLYLDGQLDRGYESDPRSRRTLEELAAAAGGAVVAEGQVAAAASAVRRALGEGERVAEGTERSAVLLAPWLALAAGLPLAFLVVRRNV